MSETRHKTNPTMLALLLFALTGGCGPLVPSIGGLGGTEFQFKQALGALLLGVTLVPMCALASALGGARRFAKSLLIAWPLSALINLGLGQDPLCASLNWRLKAIDFEECPSYREWGVVTSIENHEHVCHDPETGRLFVQSGA